MEYNVLEEAQDIASEKFNEYDEAVDKSIDVGFELGMQTEGWEETTELLNDMADDLGMSYEERQRFFLGVVERMNNEIRLRKEIRSFLAKRYPEYRDLDPMGQAGRLNITEDDYEEEED